MSALSAPPAQSGTQARVLQFIGVSTAGSSIQRVFPAWAAALGLGDAALAGVDLPPGAPAAAHRAVVAALRDDPRIGGALVTTHKIDLFNACRDLFDEVDPHAARLHEASCLAKRGDGRLAALAMDPHTSALALAGLLPRGFFADGGDAVVLGAGGAGTAIAWTLLAPGRPWGRPARAILTDRDAARLAAARVALDGAPVEYVLVEDATGNDAVLARSPARSLVVNATGLGKDRAGSPITTGGALPHEAVAWELNYRGALGFLHQARGEAGRGVRAEDGWTYFLHGWLAVIGEVFGREVPREGPLFEDLSRIAAAATGRAG